MRTVDLATLCKNTRKEENTVDKHNLLLSVLTSRPLVGGQS